MKIQELKNLVREEVRNALSESNNEDLYVVWMQNEENGPKTKMCLLPKSKAMTAANNVYRRYEDDLYIEVGIMPKSAWDKETNTKG